MPEFRRRLASEALTLTPMSGSDRRPPRWVAGAIVALTLLAPFLGGSTTLWAQAALLLMTGLLFLLAPPRRSMRLIFNVICIALAVLPLIEFLPARLFTFPEWRSTLTRLGADLPPTVSPQPWLTLEAMFLLWLGLAWTYYLFSYEWDAASREKTWDAYCFIILSLAAILVTSYALKWRVPFWPNVPEYGFFPNRNQTSNVLGLGGIMLYANAFQHLERGRRRGWLWLGGLALICWALILNYSRAGIILFFAGALIWHVCWLTRSDSREAVSRAIAWGPLAILLALLLVAGGDTLLRFKHATDLFSSSQNGRLLIQRDAFELFKTSPLLGIGLGNFRSLFSAHRHFFVNESEAIHPESDWLWSGVEMGLLAPLLIGAGLVIWLVRCFPFNRGTWRGMRMAAMICGILFACHGVLDVSGHRIGALWPALFLAATAMNPERTYASSAVLPPIFRTIGLAFAAFALWWFASIFFEASTPPTTATVQRLLNEIGPASAEERYDKLLSLTSDGLRAAPLNWIFYYNRGVAEARLHEPRSDVARDFSVARFLMPQWPGLYLKEGLVCLSAGQIDTAFEIWHEAMERMNDPRALYTDIYELVKNDADLRERWRVLAQPNKACVLIFLSYATPAEFQIELARILSENPELRGFTPEELKRLFELWHQRGEKLALAETLRAHPEWQEIAWRELARIYADYQDYHQAYDTLMRFAGVDLPEIDPNDSIDAIAARFRISGGDENDGILLARAQAARGQVDDALAVLTVLSTRPHASPLVKYVEAQLWAQKKDWAKAWQAMWTYVVESRR
jgi:tetratricopeptide (TPR) repeat protein/O-antigen ligase